RTITFSVTDANSDGEGAEGNSDDSTVTITAVNNPPVLDVAGLAYTEGDGAVVVDAALTLTDADDTEMQSAEVQITDAQAGDKLTFTAVGGISLDSTSTDTHLIFTGTASIADYLTLLRSVSYESTSDDPTAVSSTRTITF